MGRRLFGFASLVALTLTVAQCAPACAPPDPGFGLRTTTTTSTTTTTVPIATGMKLVDPVNGNDANDGSQSAPWRTLTKAAASALPGDQVWISAGVYTEGLHPTVSGIAGDRTVFMRHPDAPAGSVVLRGKCVRIIGQSNIEIRGLRIENCTGGSNDMRGIYVQGNVGGKTVSDIVIVNNSIYWTYSSAISIWGVPWGANPGDFNRINGIVISHNTIERANDGGSNEQITLANGVRNFEISGNTLFNGLNGTNGGEGIDMKEGVAFGAVHHNVIHDIARRAIYIDGGGRDSYDSSTHNIDVYSNRAWNVPEGLAIMSEGGEDVYNINVFNNLFWNVSDDGMFIYDHLDGKDEGQFTDIRIYNNTFWDVGRSGLDLNSDQIISATVNNNILKSYLDRFDKARTATNLVGGTPGFVDVTGDDYHLVAGSPGVDTASTAVVPPADIDGTSRPQGDGYDIGAYERG